MKRTLPFDYSFDRLIISSIATMRDFSNVLTSRKGNDNKPRIQRRFRVYLHWDVMHRVSTLRVGLQHLQITDTIQDLYASWVEPIE